jgi:hypothetical protein
LEEEEGATTAVSDVAARLLGHVELEAGREREQWKSE